MVMKDVRETDLNEHLARMLTSVQKYSHGGNGVNVHGHVVLENNLEPDFAIMGMNCVHTSHKKRKHVICRLAHTGVSGDNGQAAQKTVVSDKSLV